MQNNNLLFVQCAVMYMFFFRKWPGCALIGACALIRTNTVLHANVKHVSIVFVKFQSYSWKTVVGVDRPMKALYICI